MSDNTKELLELAAIAMGYEGSCKEFRIGDRTELMFVRAHVLMPWEPHNDDGDSVRMCDALRIGTTYFNDSVGCEADQWSTDAELTDTRYIEFYADHGNDIGKARRMAALRVAAKIGERICEQQKQA